MRNLIFSIFLLLAALLCVSGCSPAPNTPTSTISELGIVTPTGAPSYTPTSPEGYPVPIQIPEEITSTSAYPAPADTAYPGPAVSTPAPPGAYPEPISSTPTSLGAYPGPVTDTPAGGGSATVTPTSNTISGPTPTGSSTPLTIPLEYPPGRVSTPPAPGSLVQIWISWDQSKIQALDRVIDSFQDIYPAIRFEVTNFPPEDLRRRYEAAAYHGGGPNLLMASAEWGPAYFENGLVRDLSPFTSEEFLAQINPAALDTGRYEGALISLPVSQQGVVLIRNSALIPSVARTFDELISAARAATRGGNLGAYFDRGAFYSAANLAGLGGDIMDSDQNPAFNGPAGLAWLELLEAYDAAGAVGLNTNRDVDLFKTGRIGYIIEGTWAIDSLALAIGEENLVIDPWPDYGTGHLSGFVQAEAVFLNPNSSANDWYSSMLFMGYLLTPDVQQYLAEFGMIPVTMEADPRPMFISQAAYALERGTAFPPVANPHILTAYWEGLEMAIQDVFIRRVEPQDALLRAEELTLDRLRELNP
jgi:ABC-type glycerol-3-phosphate transport system substrate-binding protein